MTPGVTSPGDAPTLGGPTPDAKQKKASEKDASAGSAEQLFVRDVIALHDTYVAWPKTCACGRQVFHRVRASVR